MKILFLSRLFLPHLGGVERHVEELSLELMKRGHQITIITEQYSNDLKLEEIYKGIKIVRIPYFAIGSKRLVWTWMDEHNYLIEQADLVHIHDVFWWYWPTRLLQLIKPVYITFHGYEGNDLPRWQAVVQRKLAELASNGSICVGDFMKKWYVADPKEITYGATIFNRCFSAKRDNSEGVYWGRYDTDTGILTYLDSVARIDSLDRLHLYGDGELMITIRKVARKNKKIVVHGWQSRLEKIVDGRGSAFVSQYLSILEAMYAKMLVISVYSNDMKKDYLECHPMRDNMIIAGSAQELADKVNEIEKDPARRKRMTDRAYTWAKEQTWSKMADLYERLWQK